jgi:predicted ATPase
MSEVAEERPLLCVIDDAQWLDHASAAAIGFVARRLLAEPVVVLLGTRGPIDEFARLPEIDVRGLRDGDARELLASVIRSPLDAQVRERIVAETRGNPLALLELPRGLMTTRDRKTGEPRTVPVFYQRDGHNLVATY